jgi:hypothetical protein
MAIQGRIGYLLAGSEGSMLILLAFGCSPLLCPRTFVGDRAFSVDGASFDVPADTVRVVIDGDGVPWRTDGSALFRGDVVVGSAAIHDLAVIDGVAASVDGEGLHLPADADPEPIPEAPDANAAMLAGTEADLWVLGLGAPVDDLLSAFTAHRVGDAWTVEAIPGMVADWTAIAADADGDRAAFASSREGRWRIAEHRDNAWTVSDPFVEFSVDGLVFGGDGELWATATNQDDQPTALRPGVCESILDATAAKVALVPSAGGVDALAVGEDGVVRTFAVSGDCEVAVPRDQAGPFGMEYVRTQSARSGAGAILGRWRVDRHGSGFEFSELQACY